MSGNEPAASRIFPLFNDTAKMPAAAPHLRAPLELSVIDMAAADKSVHDLELDVMDIRRWGHIEWQGDQSSGWRPVVRYHEAFDTETDPGDFISAIKDPNDLPTLFIEMTDGRFLVTPGDNDALKYELSKIDLAAWRRYDRYAEDYKREGTDFTWAASIEIPVIYSDTDRSVVVPVMLRDFRQILFTEPAAWREFPGSPALPATSIRMKNGECLVTIMDNNDLAALIEQAEREASERDPGAITAPLLLYSNIMPDNVGNDGTVMLRSYKDIVSWSSIEWAAGENGAWHPVQDYNGQFNSQTIFRPEGGDSSRLPKIFIELGDNNFLLSSDTMEEMAETIEEAMTRDRIKHIRKERDFTFTESVILYVAQPGKLQGVTEMVIRDSSSLPLVKGTLQDIEWEEIDGGYSSLDDYNDVVNSEICMAPAYRPGDPTPYLPPTLLTLENGRFFLCWEESDDIELKITQANNSAREKTGKAISNRQEYEPVPQPQEQQKPRLEIGILEAGTEEQEDDWEDTAPEFAPGWQP